MQVSSGLVLSKGCEGDPVLALLLASAVGHWLLAA